MYYTIFLVAYLPLGSTTLTIMATNYTPANPYQGPVKPGYSESLFRATGQSAIPMSSSTNPAAANYVIPASSQSTQKNISGNSLYGATPANPYINPATGVHDDNYYSKNNPQSSGAAAGTPQPTTYRDPSTGQDFASYDSFMNEINNAYGPSFDYLNQAEGALKSDLPNALQAAQGNYDINAQQLGDSRLKAGEALDTQKGKATNTYENALADARRMYQEQQIGATQRFGGSSSAGQAFSEIQSREQARQFGQTNRQFTDVANQIETQRNQVEREYNTGVMQLQQQKQDAISQANRDFQNKLLTIANNRAQIGQAKAEARLGALQQLRNEVFTIEQQNKQFEQTLALQRQQAQLQLGNFSTAASGYVGAGQNAANTNYNTGPGVNPANGLNQTNGQNQWTGVTTKRPEDLYSGPISTSYRDPYGLAA